MAVVKGTFKSLCGRWLKTAESRDRHELFCERCIKMHERDN